MRSKYSTNRSIFAICKLVENWVVVILRKVLTILSWGKKTSPMMRLEKKQLGELKGSVDIRRRGVLEHQ